MTRVEIVTVVLALLAGACSKQSAGETERPGNSSGQTAGSGAPTMGQGTPPTANGGTSGSGSTSPNAGGTPQAGSSSSSGGNGASPGNTGGNAGSDDASGGNAGQGVDTSGGLRPLDRDPSFMSTAPALGERLPEAPAGMWKEETVAGTVCRDGSPMRIYYKYSDASSNYFVFLEGGGVCFDDFFCPLNPQNVNERVDGESILAAAISNLGGAEQNPQMPNGEGIFKDDPANPLAKWNAVYVPYCSGDVYGGTRKDVTVPRWPDSPPQQFQGFANVSLVAGRVIATFPDAEKALLTGSSAGGVGALLNSGRFADLLADKAPHTRGFVVSDSGPVFSDPYLEPCIQKEWRELWGLKDAFPKDCEGCFNADGGGIAPGFGKYLFKKFNGEDQVLGGLISSVDDEIMEMFFGKGLDNCSGNPFYPEGRYLSGLTDFATKIATESRFATYFMPGTFHMHLTNSRFYATNETSMSIAAWLTQVLDNKAVHVAPTAAP